MKGLARSLFLVLYEPVAIATFIFLTFFDGFHYTWWNWIIALPLNFLFSQFWPVYWAIMRPIFGV